MQKDNLAASLHSLGNEKLFYAYLINILHGKSLPQQKGALIATGGYAN